MRYVYHESLEQDISMLGLGSWVFGGKNWGGGPVERMAKTVLAALDQGINLIDTSPCYGQGRAEALLGHVLRGQRKNVILATKCGVVRSGARWVHDLRPESLTQELEGSLRRLQTDYIDILFCHWPDPKTPLEETLACLNRLKHQGKIRSLGLANFSLSQVQEGLALTDIAAFQGQYSLLVSKPEQKEVLSFCQKQGLIYMAYGVLAGGLLSGKYQDPPRLLSSDVRKFFYPFYEGKKFARAQGLLLAISKRLRRPLNQLSINWVRHHLGDNNVLLIGCRHPEHVRANVESLQWEYAPDELQDVEECRYEYLKSLPLEGD